MRKQFPAWLALALLAPPLLAQRPAALSRLVWFDRAGVRLEAVGPVADHGNLEISPDGTTVAVAVRDSGTGAFDIWLYDLDGGGRRPFTSDAEADENWLIWSPGGTEVMLNSFSREGMRLRHGRLGGPGAPVPLVSGAGGMWPVSWSADGDLVLYVTNGEGTGNDIWVLPVGSGETPYPFLRTSASENWAAFSPDGRWVAFSTTDRGRVEVYVSPFPATGERWQVSADGGSQARWRRDGREIFYVAPDRTLVAAAVDGSGDEFTVQGHEALFRMDYPYGAYHAFEASPDGQRFLVNTLVVDPGASGVEARRSPGRAPGRDPAGA